MNFIKISTLSLFFIYSSSLFANPTTQQIQDTFACKETKQNAESVLKFLNAHSVKMTEDDFKKLDWPDSDTFYKLDKQISIFGVSSQYFSTHSINANGIWSLTFFLAVPSKNSLKEIQDLAKKLDAQPDTELNEAFDLNKLNMKSYTIYTSKMPGYNRTLEMNNASMNDEKHNPWPLITISCNYAN